MASKGMIYERCAFIALQVSDNETMRVNVTLVQHSCLDGVVNIRDGGDGGEGEGEGRGAGRRGVSLSDGGGGSGMVARDGELINRVGFFNMTSSLSGGGGGGFSFNSTRPLVTLELTSRNKTCRVNMQLRVVAVPAKSKSRGREFLVFNEI